MATLYLDRKGAALDIDAGSLTVRLGGELATRIPLVPLERVVLRGDAVLSTRVLAELWRHDIGLLLLSGRHNEATARLVGRPHDDVALRLAQYRRASDAEACRETARHIVGAKLAAEARLLGRALEVRPDRRKPLTDAIATLARLQARIAGEAERLDRDTLTGLEGAGAAAYFRAYANAVPRIAGVHPAPPAAAARSGQCLPVARLHASPPRGGARGADRRARPAARLSARPRARARVAGLRPGRAAAAACRRVGVAPLCRAASARRAFLARKGRRLPDGQGRTPAFYDGFEPLAAGLRRLLRRMARGLAADLRSPEGAP